MPSDASEAPTPPCRRVLVPGGGIAGLTAARALTATKADRARFDVTVRQFGSRLGGTCASGRGPVGATAARVLEHGLHIFAGFHHNAFALLRGCDGELGCAGGVRAKDMFDALRPKNEIVLIERVGSRLVPWPIDVLETEGAPGEGRAVPTVAGFVESLLAALVGHLTRGAGAPADAARRAPPDAVAELPDDLARRVGDAIARGDPDVVARNCADDAPPPGDDEGPGRFALRHAALVAHAGARAADGSGGHVPPVVDLLGAFEADAGRWITGAKDWFRRLPLGANLARAVVSGIHGDDVTGRGFDHLDALELTDSLGRGRGDSRLWRGRRRLRPRVRR